MTEKTKQYQKEYQKIHYLKNKERINLRHAKYRSKNKEKAKTYQDIYRSQNGEKMQTYQKEYYIKNKDRVLKRMKNHLLENKEKVKESHKKYYLKNKDKITAQVIKYRSENKESFRKYHLTYHRNRMKTDINYRLGILLRLRLHDAVKNNFKAGSAVRDLGCTISELKFYLEGQFKDGMTWENWSLYGWHIDHKLPLAFFNLTDREQFLKAVHYTNLQPMWATDNLKKGAKLNYNTREQLLEFLNN